jgi:hypothetical protein
VAGHEHIEGMEIPLLCFDYQPTVVGFACLRIWIDGTGWFPQSIGRLRAESIHHFRKIIGFATFARAFMGNLPPEKDVTGAV